MVILGNESCDVIAGVYTGPKAESKIGSVDGGVINRIISFGVAQNLYFENIPYVMLNPEQSAIDESTKVARANAWHLAHNAILINFECKESYSSGIKILSNTRPHSGAYGQLLYNELIQGLQRYKLPIKKPQYSDEYALLENTNCHSFHVVVGSVNNDGVTLRNPRFHDHFIQSITNGILSCQKYVHA